MLRASLLFQFVLETTSHHSVRKDGASQLVHDGAIFFRTAVDPAGAIDQTTSGLNFVTSGVLAALAGGSVPPVGRESLLSSARYRSLYSVLAFLPGR